MVDYSENASPNIVGLLVGLITIPVMLGVVVGFIWLLSILASLI